MSIFWNYYKLCYFELYNNYVIYLYVWIIYKLLKSSNMSFIMLEFNKSSFDGKKVKYMLVPARTKP